MVLVFLIPLFLAGLEDFAGAAVGSGKRHGLLADVARQGEVEPAVAGDDSVGEQGKVAVAGEDGNGGRSDCGGDFTKQFLLFSFSGQGEQP